MKKVLDSEEDFCERFKSNSKTRLVQGHSAKVHSVDWNCDGRRLASGSYDKMVAVYNLERDRLSKETLFRGHTESVDQLCWHPKLPDILGTASLDKTVRFWDVRTNRCVSTIATKGENINMCWSPDGKTVAVGDKQDLVTFIDFRAKKIRQEQKFAFEVNEISWNNDNDLFFLTSGTGKVHVLSYPQLATQAILSAHPATCISIEFDRTGNHFAVGAGDAMVSIWDANHLCCLRTVNRLEYPARTISFSFDSKLLASASEDLTIDICHVETGNKVGEIPTESSTFTVAFHPKKYLLAFACDDKETFYTRDQRGDQKGIRDAGTVKVFGFHGES